MRRSDYLTPAKLREIEARYAADPDVALIVTEIRCLRVRVNELEAPIRAAVRIEEKNMPETTVKTMNWLVYCSSCYAHQQAIPEAVAMLHKVDVQTAVTVESHMTLHCPACGGLQRVCVHGVEDLNV